MIKMFVEVGDSEKERERDRNIMRLVEGNSKITKYYCD